MSYRATILLDVCSCPISQKYGDYAEYWRFMCAPNKPRHDGSALAIKYLTVLHPLMA